MCVSVCDRERERVTAIQQNIFVWYMLLVIIQLQLHQMNNRSGIYYNDGITLPQWHDFDSLHRQQLHLCITKWIWLRGIPLGYTTPPLNRYAVVVSATLQWFIFLKDCILIHLTVIHVDYRWWKLSLLKSELLSHLDHAEGDENLSRVGHSGDQRITCLEDSHQLSSAEEEMWEMLLQIPPSLEM